MVIQDSFHIETYGCTFNQGDSQLIRTYLKKIFREVEISQAEFIIINTCGVKAQTEHKIFALIKNIHLEEDQKLIISGCLPWIFDNNAKKILQLNTNIVVIIDTDSIEDLTRLILKYQKTGKIMILSKNIKKQKQFTEIDGEGLTGIVPIGEGCVGNCSFCCTRTARGKVMNYSSDSILQNVANYIQSGRKEIYLTSQNCGIYRKSKNDLADLLNLIRKKFANDEFIIRVGMLEPSYLIKNVNKLLSVLKDHKFYNFVHIPIQSASNQVLRSMNRPYTKENLIEIFEIISETQDFSISTDIICGFPSETTRDFLETMKFVEQFKPYIINISKYTHRPGTAARMMNQLKSETVKKRSKELSKIVKGYRGRIHKNYHNRILNCLINKYNPEKFYPYSGKTSNYMPVVLKKAKINEFNSVKIVGSTPNYLIGESFHD